MQQRRPSQTPPLTRVQSSPPENFEPLLKKITDSKKVPQRVSLPRLSNSGLFKPISIQEVTSPFAEFSQKPR